MKIALIYGSTTGNTEFAAEMLQKELGTHLSNFTDVSNIAPNHLLQYDVLILGCPTWHIGELQDDWDDFLPQLDGLDLSGKKIALFGMGDAWGYPDNFLDALGLLWEKLKELGSPTLIGAWPTKGYEFDESLGMYDKDHFLGLGLDEENQPELHEERIKQWSKQLLQELGIAAA